MVEYDDYDEDGQEEDHSVIGTPHVLLSYLTSDPELWVRAGPLLKEEYFSEQDRNLKYEEVITFVNTYKNEHGAIPSKMIIQEHTGVPLETPDDASHRGTQDYILARLEEFCRHVAVQKLLVDGSERINKDRSRATVQDLYKQMESLTKLTIQREIGYEVHDSTLKVLKDGETKDGISTGFALLDQAIGGTPKPSLNIYSASSGHGKSIKLQNLAINYSRMGKNVVFYTLELVPEVIQKRFAAMMTDTPMSAVYRNLESIHFRMSTEKSKSGLIWLQKFKALGTTMADIQAHFQELRAMMPEVEWDVCCLDYIDIMDPVTSIRRDNLHLKDRYVMWEFHDFLSTHELIGWTASQQVKGADDDKQARTSGVSGGTERINAADTIIIGKRNEEDVKQEMLWETVIKGRHGGTFMKVPIRWNRDTQRMTDGDVDDFVKANPYLAGQAEKLEQNTKSILATDRLAQEKGLAPKPVPELKQTEQNEHTRNKLRSRIKQQRYMGKNDAKET